MTYAAHCPPAAWLAFVLAGCVTGCAEKTPAQSSRSLSSPAAAVGTAMPPDPAREREIWHAPEPARLHAGSLAWAGTSAPVPCRAAINTGPVTRVDNEADFQALFCRRSDVAWQRLQLFVYRLTSMTRAWQTEAVVLNDSQINWLLVAEPCADWADASAPPAILLARSDLPVIARPKSGVPVDCPTGDGYGY